MAKQPPDKKVWRARTATRTAVDADINETLDRKM